jgi:hypothetical protein
MHEFLEKMTTATVIEKYMLVDVNKIGHGISKGDKSFGIKFYNTTSAGKKIEWQFVVYIDFYGGDRLFTDIRISNESNINRFRMKDYYKYCNLLWPEQFETGLQSSSILHNTKDLDLYLLNYLTFINSILCKDEFQKILFTNYWIDVLIDYSQYK